jgi:catalase
MLTHATTLSDLWRRAAHAAQRLTSVPSDGGACDLSGRHVAVLAADGVDLEHVDKLKVALRRAGAKVTVMTRHANRVRGCDGRTTAAKAVSGDLPALLFDALYVPGGDASVKALSEDAQVLHFVQQAYRHGMAIAVSGRGAQVLRAAGVHVPDETRQAALLGLFVSHALHGLEDRLALAIALNRRWRSPG